MNIDLNASELSTIMRWYQMAANTTTLTETDTLLVEKISDKEEEALEFESVVKQTQLRDVTQEEHDALTEALLRSSKKVN